MNRSKIREVVDCASPLALLEASRKRRRWKSARGLAQSKTLPRRFRGQRAKFCFGGILSQAMEPQSREDGCVADQPQHLSNLNTLRLVEDDTAALHLHGKTRSFPKLVELPEKVYTNPPRTVSIG